METLQKQSEQLVGQYIEIMDCPHWIYKIYSVIYNVNCSGEFFSPCLMRCKLFFHEEKHSYEPPDTYIDEHLTLINEYIEKGYYKIYSEKQVLERVVEIKYKKSMKH
jgi:hypothetical protein